MTWEEHEFDQKKEFALFIKKEFLEVSRDVNRQISERDAEVTNNRRLGVASGMDEAIHEITKTKFLDMLSQDPEFLKVLGKELEAARTAIISQLTHAAEARGPEA